MLAGMLMTARRWRPKIVIAYVFGMLWLLSVVKRFGFVGVCLWPAFCWSITHIAHGIKNVDQILVGFQSQSFHFQR